MGNSTENTYKIYENRSKQKEDTGTWTDKKEKATSEKITIQLQEINQKVLVTERLKTYRQRLKQDIPKQRKKILLNTGRR